MRFRAIGSRASLLFSSLIAGMLFLGACSTLKPEPNPRNGLLEDLDRPRPAKPSRRSPAVIPREYYTADARVTETPEIPNLNRIPLRWPLQHVEVTSPFGKRGRNFHEGVDLHAVRGTPVYAAHSGRVLYAGSRIRGYGRMVIIKHSLGLATVYAHNSKLLVKRGMFIRIGQNIAISGGTGHVSGPHLHFEVRNGVGVVDPARILPLVPRSVAKVKTRNKTRRVAMSD